MIDIEIYTLGGDLKEKISIKKNQINNIYNIINNLEFNKNKLYTLVCNQIQIYSNFNKNLKEYNFFIDNQYFYTFNIIYKSFQNEEHELMFKKVVINKECYIIDILHKSYAMDILLNIDKIESCNIDFDYDFDGFSSEYFSKQNIIDLINHDYYIIHILEDIYKNDKDIALAAVKQKECGALGELSDEFINDKEIVLIAIKNTHWAFQFMSDELCNNKEFSLEIISNFTPEYIQDISNGVLDYFPKHFFQEIKK